MGPDSPNPAGEPVVELPEFVKGINIDDLNRLRTNLPALSGLWEKSDTATAIHEHHQRIASQNEAQAKSLTESASELEELNKEVSFLTEKERNAHERWQSAESKMYAITEKYSPAGIKRAIEGHLAASEQSTKEIERKLCDGLTVNEDPIAVAKQYVLKRRQYYYDKSLLESLS